MAANINQNRQPLPLSDSTMTKFILKSISLMGITLAWNLSGTGIARAAEQSSFNCKKVETGSMADLICRDAELKRLDRKMAGVYAAASRKAKNEHPPVLKAEQRGWIKGRDDCWKSEDKKDCLQRSYQDRIAELQARYRLVEHTGPFTFVCDGNPSNEVVITYFKTEPSTLIAEHGDSVSLMTVQPSGSGARYQGRNESFWEHQGIAKIIWGYQVPEMTCKLSP